MKYTKHCFYVLRASETTLNKGGFYLCFSEIKNFFKVVKVGFIKFSL